uniref:Uncharacterized protein n=1 Tax=Rhabditophanes sp. KR3021 TaxID=114890 RepID=A0AC35UA13_9BILA
MFLKFLTQFLAAKVIAPINWSNNLQYNINFIQSFITRARMDPPSPFLNTIYHFDIGVFMDMELLQGIVHFNDFRPFASWSSSSAETFATSESCCGVMIGKVDYTAGKSLLKWLPRN